MEETVYSIIELLEKQYIKILFYKKLIIDVLIIISSIVIGFVLSCTFFGVFIS